LGDFSGVNNISIEFIRHLLFWGTLGKKGKSVLDYYCRK